MVVATKTDIEKRKKKLDQFMKGLDEDGRMSEKKLCTQIRTAVRKVWMSHDVKLAYLYTRTYPDMDPNTRTKWLVDCEMCQTPSKLGDVEVDHKEGEHSLNELDDIVPFAKSILGVCFDDLQVVCTVCHEVKTYAERYDMSLEDAAKEKKVIAALKKPLAQQKKFLLDKGFANKDITNKDKRRECFRKVLDI